jgi:hypothetical protein
MALTLSLAATSFASPIFFESHIRNDRFLENNETTARGIHIAVQKHSSSDELGGNHGKGTGGSVHPVAEPSSALLLLFSLIPVAVIGAARRFQYKN